MENIKYGRRREGRWTPIRAKADIRANPNSWETHLVRKRWVIGLLHVRALSPRIMMMIINYLNLVPLRWFVALLLSLFHFQHRVGEHCIKPPYMQSFASTNLTPYNFAAGLLFAGFHSG